MTNVDTGYRNIVAIFELSNAHYRPRDETIQDFHFVTSIHTISLLFVKKERKSSEVYTKFLG